MKRLVRKLAHIVVREAGNRDLGLVSQRDRVRGCRGPLMMGTPDVLGRCAFHADCVAAQAEVRNVVAQMPFRLHVPGIRSGAADYRVIADVRERMGGNGACPTEEGVIPLAMNQIGGAQPRGLDSAKHSGARRSQSIKSIKRVLRNHMLCMGQNRRPMLCTA